MKYSENTSNWKIEAAGAADSYFQGFNLCWPKVTEISELQERQRVILRVLTSVGQTGISRQQPVLQWQLSKLNIYIAYYKLIWKHQ